MKPRVAAAPFVLAAVFALFTGNSPRLLLAQAPAGAAAGQKIDQEYTNLIRQHLQDSRITTELVDHLPASDTVPSPLKFLGRIVGTPGELTYARDIHRYYAALADASPRAKYWKIGTTEEGRDIVALAIADEQTIRSLDRFGEMLGSLTDPRKTTEADAQRLLGTAKPIYYVTSGMHSPENGGPEMLIELAYRLIVEETPFIQAIRNNVITLITPVIEVDGREKQVDTYYFNKKRAPGDARLPLMYWGKYVQHDNNRDGMGQYLELTKAITRVTLQWHPTILHDLHESQTYLYTSTGTGPYNDALDPITISEWWMLAENDVLEMAKRGVPGVWTYGFYDGWVPNYMIFIAHSHNAVGRFYEVQSYGPDNSEVRPGATTTSREWFRPNPPLDFIRWGPRNNTNIQQSALLLSLHHVAQNRRLYLENYWLKNKRAIQKGADGPIYGWLIPAGQRRKSDAAIAVNDLRAQGLEISRVSSAFKAGTVDVAAGDYIVRGDQPFRTLADMYFSIQNYAPQNPSPYDDTGWTFQLMRDIRVVPIGEKSLLDQPMTLVTKDVTAPGGIEGSGSVLIVDHTADTRIVTFRFKNASTKMLAAEADFTVDGRQFRAGALIVPDAVRSTLEPTLREYGLSAFAVTSLPEVKTHELDVPRIGYIHNWSRTQDEGWWRAALDTYGVPYTYFADQKLKEGNLRAKYDVLIFPHVGGSAVSQVNGPPVTGTAPLPYRKSDETPNLGALDSSDDIRGGMGFQGLAELARFVEQGGTLITEGSTSTIFPEYGLVAGVTLEQPEALFVRGSVLRARVADAASPLAYGYPAGDVPVYFNQAPVLNAGGAGRGGGGNGPNAGLGQNVTPNAVPLRITPFQPEDADREPSTAERPRPQDVQRLQEARGTAPGTAPAGRGATPAGRGAAPATDRPRVVLQFPSDPGQMLLSGTLANGQFLAGRAALVDSRVGQGHVVMFAIRPFWRWQTHGTYTLGFNAIMNWNDLDAR
ncbi:MAG TPA: M14 family zinc carboxypeptidase [Vicinamibacterales bacterium]|nr:M14 family zinc carboxypeptidase [Vicinamibacterales bacterium]